MPQELKTNPPPKTEILSQAKRELTDLAETSPNLGLADPSGPMAPIAPEETPEPLTETVEQPFTIDETGEGESTEEEPTHDPLKDTQRKLHDTTTKLSQLQKAMNAMIADRQLSGMQATPQQPNIPPEMFSAEPTEHERNDPQGSIRYTQRMMFLAEMNRRREATEREMENFVGSHPDWEDLLPTMQRIKQEEPMAYHGPGTLSRLYKRAKEIEELEGYRLAIKDGADKAMQAGVQMQRQKGKRAFVSPTGTGMPAGQRQIKMPPPEIQADTKKFLEWLKQNGFYREEIY